MDPKSERTEILVGTSCKMQMSKCLKPTTISVESNGTP